MWLNMRNSTTIQHSIFTLSFTSCHFLFNILCPICLLKNTASSSFLLSSMLLHSAARLTPLQQHSCLALIPLPNIPVVLCFFYPEASVNSPSYFTFLCGFVVVDCVRWKSFPVLLFMIPVLWTACCLHHPTLSALSPHLKNLKFVFE